MNIRFPYTISIVALSIFIATNMSSCALLGSQMNIYSENDFTEIRSVGVITSYQDSNYNIFHKIIKESFTKTLLTELTAADLYDVSVLDTASRPFNKIDFSRFDAQDALDAYMLVEWRILHPLNLQSNAIVTISMIDTKTEAIISKNSFNTKTGKSYWKQPRLPKELLDATRGAIKALKKEQQNLSK